MKDVKDLTHKEIADRYYEALKLQAISFKAGRMSHSEYTSHVLRAYEGLRRLGLSDDEAKSILKGVEEVAG